MAPPAKFPRNRKPQIPTKPIAIEDLWSVREALEGGKLACCRDLSADTSELFRRRIERALEIVDGVLR